MKCPKCGYLGFETTDRCRNCGYDFSLSIDVAPAPELPLRPSETPGVLADLDLGHAEPSQGHEIDAPLDLNRLIGATQTPQDARGPHPDRLTESAATASPPDSGNGRHSIQEHQDASRPMPLFRPGAGEIDDTPLITTPRPVRPPLSVRRATPDPLRSRSRAVRPTPRDEEGLALNLEAPELESANEAVAAHDTFRFRTAGRVARLVAAVIDLIILGSIDAGVLYLTLAIADLTIRDFTRIPPIPMIAFLLLLNGGYLVAFVAAGGQTLGKMAAGVCVIRGDGGRVDVGSAVLRAVGCALSLMTAGVGYLPAFVMADARALHDRIAGTRVVRSR